MVVGDGQILAQVKDAYSRAVDAGAVDSLLHRLMHTAFRAAKRVASETDLASGAASVSTAAVAMASDHFAEFGAEDLSGAHVLLVGAGKMGRLAIGALDSYAPASISVTNRSPERAREVAEEHGARTVAWEDRYEAVAAADFVVVATGAPEPVLNAGRLPHGGSASTGCPVDHGGSRADRSSTEAPSTLLIDISMPRNIDPVIGELDAFTVFDLDDLKAWTERVEKERGSEIPHAQEICETLLSDFVTWVFHQQALQPAIQAIRSTFDAIREQEVDRHAEKTGMNREEVDRLTTSIMQKLLAVPIVKLKNVDPDSISFVQGIQLLHALFSRPGCEDESAQVASDKDQAVQQRLPDADGKQPSLSDAPSDCPYVTHDPDQAPRTESGSDFATELLRQALSAQDSADR
jgi:glutamyl-tRNA reductase